MMEPKGRPHPSGRPIHERIVKGNPIWRIPDTVPNVPRLREDRIQTEAIGFVHHFPCDDNED
jgi:hypothetical protein